MGKTNDKMAVLQQRKTVQLSNFLKNSVSIIKKGGYKKRSIYSYVFGFVSSYLFLCPPHHKSRKHMTTENC